MSNRIATFDTWQPGYGGAAVHVYLAGTSTLANIYSDEALTQALDNPVILSSKTGADGVNYGKFPVPVYVGVSHYLSIDGVENTGIIRPGLSDLSGEDASEALVTAEGSSYAISLEKMASLSVNVASYGVFVEGAGGVAATNTATLELAIAALNTGGEVHIPAGTYKINSVTIPAGVVLRGSGREATVLQSTQGSVSLTLVGDRSGLRDLTLDGTTLSTGSIGVKSVGLDETVFDSVMIRRFETGMDFRGGRGHVWHDLSIENTETGAKLHGDTDAGDSGNGAAFADLDWFGGVVSVASVKGVSLSYEDAVCHNIGLYGVDFINCLGTALDINGAQQIELASCGFSGNTKNVNIQDDTDSLTPSTALDNDVINVTFSGGRINGGEFEVTGTIQNVTLQEMKLEDVDFTMTTPLTNFLILKDCFEDENVTIAGESTKLLRLTESNNGASFGITTTNSATKAWSIALEPGQIVYLEAKVIGKGRNVAQRAAYHIGCGAYRPGSTLAYDTQTANFTVGQTLTGQSSGATARIQANSDSGATGTLTLTDIKGEFIDNEIITDDNGTPGSATANGTLSHQNVSLDTVGNINIRTAYETNANWVVAFAANGPEVELRVTGDSSQTVEWTVSVDVVTT